jgi:uncharacterized protein YidB (DUF937 family)
MDITDLLQIGAKMIQENDDDATTGLDVGDITSALGAILGGGNESADGGLDIGSLVAGLAQGGLGDIVGSWLGDGENAPVDADTIKNVLGEEKVSQFAEQLGIPAESASKALADVLPSIIDKASSGDDNMVGDLLAKVGGVSGAMDILGKFLK